MSSRRGEARTLLPLPTLAGNDGGGDGRTKRHRHQIVAMAESIGELVSIAPTLAQPPDCGALLHNLKLCIEELADGSISRFVAATGVSFDTMADWSRLPERNVRLIPLCRICTLVGISPRLFVCKRLTSSDLDSNGPGKPLPKRLRISNLGAACTTFGRHWSRRPARQMADCCVMWRANLVIRAFRLSAGGPRSL